ncbi:hypothetical protein [Coleofasciculus sp.]|uniref:hypothetical protein n=1 Tax=Coleofasciculus sp. TaxID=3100458 RepID=UPI003A49FB07
MQSITNNRLIDIPENIAKLTNLEWLDLSNNPIREISNSITQIPNRQWLYLSNNRIREIPGCIIQLTRGVPLLPQLPLTTILIQPTLTMHPVCKFFSIPILLLR